MDELSTYPNLFTIATAAQATGKSADQIRRAVKAGKIMTTRDPANQAYLMTAEALIVAGFSLVPLATATPAPPEIVTKLEAALLRIRELEADRDRDRRLLDDLTSLIRDLPRAIAQAQPTATPTPGELPTNLHPATAAATPPPEAPRRRFWGSK